MVHDHADAFFGHEFEVQGGGADMPAHARDYYVSLYNRDKDALRATFGFYRAWDQMLSQNAQRATTNLTIPVLGIGGALSCGDKVSQGMMPTAEAVRTAVIPGPTVSRRPSAPQASCAGQPAGAVGCAAGRAASWPCSWSAESPSYLRGHRRATPRPGDGLVVFHVARFERQRAGPPPGSRRSPRSRTASPRVS